jgi:endoglucanase
MAFALPTLSLGQYYRGVNLAGAEFGENVIPGAIGSTHTYNSERSFQYFAARSLPLIRLPIRWERLQPVLRGPLDAINLAALKRDIAWAKANGARLVIDLHNFGRFSFNEPGGLRAYVLDNFYNGAIKVSGADLADFWVRLSEEFKAEPAVHAYDLMNEPHDMGSANWKAISQLVLTAIRNNRDNKLIMVPGDAWSAAHAWPDVHGSTSWINDPANNFAYEAHQYFDRDNSGSYKDTYTQELARNSNLATVGVTRLAPFALWCNRNNVRGYLGEYGVPNNDPGWLTVLDNFLLALDAAGFDGTYWAAGEWWGNYALSVQPQDSFMLDRPQTQVLLQHLSPDAFTSLSAASSGGYYFAPATLMSGYGKNLPSSAEGVEVEIADSSGARLLAPLLLVSSGQINYLIPPETSLGRVDITVRNAGRMVGSGTYRLENVSPGLFSANGNGRGIAAAQIVRVNPNGAQTYEGVARFDQGAQAFVPLPIDFGSTDERLYLVLYGTGFRNAANPAAASLKIGNVDVSISYLGAQRQFPGLDQINAELPRELAGAGEVTIVLKVDGIATNPVSLVFR